MFFNKGLNNKKKIIIHIGEGKTGSSTIQKFLNENRNNLLQLGYYYPRHDVDENSISSGHEFHLTKLNELLIESSNSNSTLILSSEYFYGHPKHFKDFCLEHNLDPKIICFIRDVKGRIISEYNQMIKRNAETKNFDEILEENQILFRGYSNRENYAKDWVDYFGKSIVFIPYGSKFFKDGKEGLVQFFLSVIGIKKIKINDSQNKINISYSLSALILKRELNKFFTQPVGKDDVTNQIDIALQDFSQKYTDDCKYNLEFDLSESQMSYFDSKVKTIEDSFMKVIKNNLLYTYKYSDQRTQTRKEKTRKYTFEYILNSFIYNNYPGLYYAIKHQVISSDHLKISPNFYTLELVKCFDSDLTNLRLVDIINFDAEHHMKIYPGIEQENMNPYEHFIKHGIYEGKYKFDL